MKDVDQSAAAVPMQLVGPMKLIGPAVTGEFMVPLATYESPLWPSTARGARVTAHAGGIGVVVVSECMTRSILLSCENAVTAAAFAAAVDQSTAELADVVVGGSRFARLSDLTTHVVGNLVWVRLAITSGDASGHNMVTLAAENVLNHLLEKHPQMHYVSLSGNACTDKKVSAVNGVLGRGRRVVAEACIPEKLCRRFLRASAADIVDLNVRKNLLGSIVAGSIGSANAHFANMLLAFYLATGQDAANIVEGSQGIVHAEDRDGELYFSVTLPNIIVGTVGNGKDLPFVQDNLRMLGCLEEREPGENARRLAGVAAATVLCGELSLLAALTNPGELMQAHIKMERDD
jgi:hydroxymethylglutaryl-CoA reductase (NADPH)